MSVLIIIFLTAIVALFAGVFEQGKYSRYIGLLGLAAALVVSFQPEYSFFQKYESMYLFDKEAKLFTKITIVITMCIFFMGSFAFTSHRKHQSELYALILFSVCGAITLFGFENLVTLFLGIEILSIPLYVLAGSNKSDLKSNEASLKYFLMGAFATGFLLFGIALIYGSTGSFDLATITEFTTTHSDNVMLIIGMLLMLSGIAFKVSLAPFHMWTPDVYHGSPSIITAFMATVVKISAVFTLFFMMSNVFSGIKSEWVNVMGVLIIITLILANVLGLAQTNAKKMLAYSSISHAGYLGLIFYGFTNLSVYHLAFYLFAYSLATIGVFMTLIWVEKVKRDTSFAAFKGLVKTEPLLAIVASISMLSMAGIPLTAGFMAKFSLFSQAMNGAAFLVLVAVLGSAISIAYYLRLIMMMFFVNEVTFKTSQNVTFTYNVLAIVIIIAIIALGVYPDLFSIQFAWK